MSTTYLGAEFDIHGGGTDLVFPHHENERAQSNAAGDPFARYWLHNAWVTMSGEKMSKSLGNVVSIPEMLKVVRAVELRYYLIAPHYRSNVEYSRAALDEAVSAYQRIESFVRRVGQRTGAVEPGVLCAEFTEAMDDDLGTPAALAAVHNTVREGNTALDAGDEAAARGAAASVRAMTGVLGLDPLARAVVAGRLDGVDDGTVVAGGAGAGAAAGSPRRRGTSSPPTRGATSSSRPGSPSRTPPTVHNGRLRKRDSGWEFAATGRHAQARHEEGRRQGHRWPEGQVPARQGPDAQGRAAGQPPGGQAGRGARQAAGRPAAAQGVQRGRRTGRRPQPGRRVPARRTCRRRRCTWRWASTPTTGSPRPSGWRPTGASPCWRCSAPELDRLTGGAVHQGIALQMPPFEYAHPDDLIAAADDERRAAAAGRAGRRDRPAQPGRRDPLGGRVRRQRRAGAAAAQRRRDGGGVADQCRHGGPAAGRDGHQPDPHAARLGRARADDRRPGRGRHDGTGRPVAGHRPAGRGRRLGGPRTVPAGPRDVRRDGVHPDGGGRRVAERVGRGQCGAGRGGQAAARRQVASDRRSSSPSRLTGPSGLHAGAIRSARVGATAADPREPEDVVRQPAVPVVLPAGGAGRRAGRAAHGGATA